MWPNAPEILAKAAAKEKNPIYLKHRIHIQY